MTSVCIPTLHANFLGAALTRARAARNDELRADAQKAGLSLTRHGLPFLYHYRMLGGSSCPFSKNLISPVQ